MMTLTLNGTTHSVNTVADACNLVSLSNDTVGASEWYGHNAGGAIVRDGDRIVATVSYNGRAWNPCERGETATPYVVA